jgi:hypothetical protein
MDRKDAMDILEREMERRHRQSHWQRVRAVAFVLGAGAVGLVALGSLLVSFLTWAVRS